MTPVVADPARSALARSTRLRYAVGSLGTGGFGTLPGLVLVFYLTDTLGVSALAAGVVVTLAKVWDVVIDPAVGALSDRELANRGARRRPMIVGAIALPVFFALTFAVPAGTPALAAGVWVGVGFVLCTTAFSLFQVPYIALPAELAAGYDARTRLLSTRVVVLTAAILLFGAGGPALRALGADENSGYLLMAVVAGVVIGLGMLVASGVAPRSSGVAARAAIPRIRLLEGYRTGMAALRTSQPFRALLTAFVLQGLATGLMLAAAQYVATWVLRSTDAVTLLFVALIAPALIATPVWGAIARRIGKERAYLIASILFGVAALLVTLQLVAPGAWIYAPVALAGAAYAGMQALPMAMLPDVIALDARERGTGRAGVFGGVWTAGETLGMALGATVLSIVLAATGYLSSTGATTVEQPGSAIVGIVVSFSLVPAALLAASLVPLSRYRIRRHDVDEPERASA
ncbi:Na+/melibiose symporter-like transporter [Diaminobutyricimonas aerilata]|uniref:Na+/melibiose symporter-like transporter n=1 Tax=Diaminobutyricimonas aerilata TaxID=1162967 RepID=A0A2M9CI38_9MICO|nr:MFS transporter [Diaminobutyricimonas aerilata]PJJ71586.1 Na+/melibiose symporter-like transporter [Diaminobutyricimonas aerilata]